MSRSPAAARETVDVVIIGSGVSGLTAAWRLREASPTLRIRVLEAGQRPGGAATTDRVEGFLFDRGANGFLTNVLSTWELAWDVGLGPELVEASDLSKHRFLYRNGQLNAIPMSPGGFARWPLMSAAGKLRMLREPTIPALRGATADESVLEFATRRLGAEAARVFMPALVTGIVGGDAADISLDALFPRMRAMEREHGSLVLAGIASARAAKKAGARSDGRPRPSGRLTSFRDAGMGRLTETIAHKLGDAVRLDSTVTAMRRFGPADRLRWHVDTTHGGYDTRAVVMAMPAHAVAPLVEPFDPAIARLASEVKFAGIRVFGLGFRDGSLRHPLDGFGFLVPRGQGLRILGCLWSSSVFPDQAAPNGQHMRVMAGGAFDPDLIEMSDDEALEVCLRDLRKALGVRVDPQVVHPVNWKRTIPQYHKGHLARVTRLEAALAAHPRLYVTGNSWRGVGINDCVTDGNRVARDVLAGW
jgi:oxygen-dependent protoporphyrinogen oxidase